MRTRPTALDFIIIAAVLAVAVWLLILPIFSSHGEEVTVSVRKGSETFTFKECPIDEPQSFEVENNGIRLTVVIDEGAVWVEAADCDDRVCVHSGKISRSGQSIICAPAGVVINVSGGESDEDISAG